ncbi:FAD-binding oxidoreductase [Paenibacillus glycanilyticus]|uniref:FAD-linked oxidoreductase YitY n=1 Tax=Paenibacillus glycanilyticus TaxID=126569 RepID=A0ABQ6G715_9BACL|nr:FAD-binding oxidoreductase [Paenibacillus glycanilyticus]GLX66038.1 putative FAD-linked oxidoreductase YitY [Paenibacillus glycanilyticus]
MAKKTIAITLLIALSVITYFRTSSADQNPYLVTDYSRLHPVKVERVVKGKEETQLIHLLQDARKQHLKVSIAGQRHSQGGHTYYKDGIVVDMTGYNRILSIDREHKKITVQAGATWEDIQEAVNRYGLAVRTMQSQNTFTVGGSISVNAHGRDIRNGSMIKSVDSFRLLMADGQIKQVSHSENAELFPLALGGYGLFGIILDVTLLLDDDELYSVNTETMPTADYVRYFMQEVKTNPDIRMHIARISVSRGSFLTEMFAKNYTLDHSEPLEKYSKLTVREPWTAPGKLLFQLNRSFDWGKTLTWDLQTAFFTEESGELISRNNAMRAAWQFMEYDQPDSSDLLQEYFIPVRQFDDFVEAMGKIVRSENLNLLNITVRYVNEDNEAVLSYAKQDMFALVCLFNVPLSSKGQSHMEQSVRQIVDEAISRGGTYYLPYAGYPSLEQFRAAYPEYRLFFQKKLQYDPGELFMNTFYEQYKGGGAE